VEEENDDLPEWKDVDKNFEKDEEEEESFP